MKKIILLLTIIVAIFVYKENKNNEVIIPNSAIRLRVIPNSNSALDQNMKIKVKKYLEGNTYELLKDEDNIEDARKIISNNLDEIDRSINEIFIENNYEVPYKVNFGYNYFPSKEYRGVKYKEGYYESLVIGIGKSEGDNYWCVLFPNLCLVDLENSSNTEYKSWVAEKINKIFK